VADAAARGSGPRRTGRSGGGPARRTRADKPKTGPHQPRTAHPCL